MIYLKKSVKSEEEKSNTKITKDEIKKDNFRIQFASFREKQKSLEISSKLKEKNVKDVNWYKPDSKRS